MPKRLKKEVQPTTPTEPETESEEPQEPKTEVLAAPAPEEPEPPTPEPEETVAAPPEGEGDMWVYSQVLNENYLCEDAQVEGLIKILLGRLPVNGEIMVKRVK